MLYLLLATYGTVFLTELVGDKSIYTIGSLSTRFHYLPVFCGIAAAFMGKILVAVLVGQAVAELPRTLVAVTSAAAFFLTALFIWRNKEKTGRVEKDNRRYSSRALLISFAAVFFSEWGDSGQVVAAALAARYRAPVIVWLGATLALVTKGVLAMTLGVGLRKHVPQKILRPVTISLCLFMGVASALQLWN